VVGSEGAEGRQPKCCRGNATATRLRHARRQARGNASSQHARAEIHEGLHQHDGFPAWACPEIDNRQERRIAWHPSIRRQELSMRVEAVHAVVEPVARELFVVRRISGVEREAPDEKKTQEQSREERWQEMLDRKSTRLNSSHGSIS